MGLVEVTLDPRGVAVVTLSRAEKHNALSAEMMVELHEVADRLGQDPSVRVVVLAGAGRSFCAGADLGWMQEQMEADAEGRAASARTLAHMLMAWNLLPKPVIGRVQGNAFGGGVGLMAVCDTVVAVESARFAFTETRLGLIPATIGPYILARLGEGKARRVFMSARAFDAAEARELGLVARVVAPDELDAAVEAEVAPYLACAPGAVAAAKAEARRMGPVIDEAAIEASIAALAACWETGEAREGVAAFFEKRRADWVIDS